MKSQVLVQTYATVEAELLARVERFRSCVSDDRSVEIDAPEHVRLAIGLLESSRLRRFVSGVGVYVAAGGLLSPGTGLLGPFPTEKLAEEWATEHLGCSGWWTITESLREGAVA